VDERLQRRVAANESAFREVNEAIERGLWPGEHDSPIAFRCECASLDCNQLIELTPREYERIRADPRRFLILCGHELPEVETVLETHARYVVVQKRAAAAKRAHEIDPRS
jgi:hypothetical protein